VCSAYDVERWSDLLRSSYSRKAARARISAFRAINKIDGRLRERDGIPGAFPRR
jgi:hypothetical protein